MVFPMGNFLKWLAMSNSFYLPDVCKDYFNVVISTPTFYKVVSWIFLHGLLHPHIFTSWYLGFFYMVYSIPTFLQVGLLIIRCSRLAAPSSGRSVWVHRRPGGRAVERAALAVLVAERR
jgi:hypothetical protein